METPSDYCSGALPVDAFVNKVVDLPRLPESSDPELEAKAIIHRLRAHTLDEVSWICSSQFRTPCRACGCAPPADVLASLVLSAQTCVHLGLAPTPRKPLKSPWAASVTVVSLETSVYLLAVAESWIRIDPVLCPRWWHI